MFEVCKGQGLVYHRKKQACDIQIADIECTWDGVEAYFNGAQTFKDNRALLSGQGYMVDQCGVNEDGNLVVHLYCLAEDSEKQCVDESELDPENKVVVKVQLIRSG